MLSNLCQLLSIGPEVFRKFFVPCLYMLLVTYMARRWSKLLATIFLCVFVVMCRSRKCFLPCLHSVSSYVYVQNMAQILHALSNMCQQLCIGPEYVKKCFLLCLYVFQQLYVVPEDGRKRYVLCVCAYYLQFYRKISQIWVRYQTTALKNGVQTLLLL